MIRAADEDAVQEELVALTILDYRCGVPKGRRQLQRKVRGNYRFESWSKFLHIVHYLLIWQPDLRAVGRL